MMPEPRSEPRLQPLCFDALSLREPVPTRLKTPRPGSCAAAAKRPDNNNAINIWKRPGNAWPLHRRPWWTVEILFRRRRQRNRAVGQRAQIGDHISALRVLLDTGKAHRGAGNVTLRVGDELAEVVIAPGAALGLHGRREIEPASLALVVTDDAEQVRADAVGAALLKRMAGGALLGGGRALFDGGGLEQFLDRLGWRRGFLAPPLVSLFLHGNLKARPFRHPWRKKCTRGQARHQEQNAGAEDGTDHFIKFEGVHSGSGSRAGRSTEGRQNGRGFASGIRLSRRTLSRVEISVCPRSGNPYKRPDFPPIPIISGLFSRRL